MQNLLHLFTQIKEDLAFHRGEWSRPGFQTLAVHRIGVWTKSIKTKAIRAPLYQLAKVGHVFCRNFYGIELPFEAIVGRRVVFEHQHGIVIHGSCVIQDGCTIRQGVTLGIKSTNNIQDAPILSRNVDVGAGAKILGRVYVGHDVKIGANSVVTKSVPPHTTVVGCNKWIQTEPPLPWDEKEIANWLMGKHCKAQA